MADNRRMKRNQVHGREEAPFMSKGAEHLVLTWGHFAPRDIWQYLEIFFVGIIGRRFYWHLIGRDQGRC